MKYVLDAIKANQPVTDADFDLLFPDEYREFSSTHFTPFAIARRAAELLAPDADSHILDVGSGLGKFCITGALTTAGQFTGVEQRPHLVKYSNRIVRELNIPRVNFIEGDIRLLDWTQFQGVYLFNPFIENLYPPHSQMDHCIEVSEPRYKDLVRWVQQRLHRMPLGMRVATYHGFGGDMPPGYELLEKVPGGGDFLCFWVKTS